MSERQGLFVAAHQMPRCFPVACSCNHTKIANHQLHGTCDAILFVLALETVGGVRGNTDGLLIDCVACSLRSCAGNLSKYESRLALPNDLAYRPSNLLSIARDQFIIRGKAT
jgi:hypothetical protein